MTHIEDIKKKRRKQKIIAMMFIVPIVALFIPVYVYENKLAGIVLITLFISLPIYRLTQSIKCPKCTKELQKHLVKDINIIHCPYCGLDLKTEKTEPASAL